MLRRRGKVKHEWADWSGEESCWRTYFGLGAEHRIADVTQVAVGIERGALDLKVSILLRARARHENLRFSLEFSAAILSLSGFTLMLRLEKCRFLE